MKYYITVFLLSLGFLLSGYKQVAKSSDLTSPWSKSSDKTSKSEGSDKDDDEDEDDVHEDGDLTLREIKVINKALNSPKYYGFLLSEYDEPKYIDWNEVFYIGAGLSEVKRTASIEEAYLDETGNMEVIADLTILSADDIKDFVKKTTGLSYSKMRNPLDWVYLEDEDVYVFEHGDTNQIKAEVISGYVEDGVFTVRYEHYNWWGENADCEFDLSFTMNDDYYCFISNIPDLETGKGSEYIFPDSDSRNLSEEDLSGLDAETLRIGRNEIYARHGRQFKDSTLQSYFNEKSWYEPTNDSDSKIENSLNKYEKNNIKLIQSYESKAPASAAKPKSSSSSNSGSKKSSSGYTNAELCKMAQDYYERHYDFRPPIAEVDSTDGDNVTIHLYEELDGHTATSAWYVINKKTGKGYDDLFGDSIDLTK